MNRTSTKTTDDGQSSESKSQEASQDEADSPYGADMDVHKLLSTSKLIPRTFRPTVNPSVCRYCSDTRVERTSLDGPCPYGYDPKNQATNNLKGDRLCYLCSRLDFQDLFAPVYEGSLSIIGNGECVINRDISVVRKNTQCPLCRLLLQTLELDDGVNWLGCVVLRGYPDKVSLRAQDPWGKHISIRRIWIVGLDREQYFEIDDQESSLMDLLAPKYSQYIQL